MAWQATSIGPTGQVTGIAMMCLFSHAGKTTGVGAGIALLALLLTVLPVHAHAKGKGGHGYYDHHHHRDYRPRGRPQHHHHHYYHQPKRRSNEGAYLLGGIVIGSVLTHALHQPRYAPAPAVGHHAPAPGRRLLKDAYGDCYERRGYGANEVLIPLPDWECAW
jgi:hypothetical protein